MKLIPLTQGQFAKVDNEDFEWINKYKWYFAEGYARRMAPGKRNSNPVIRMHRDILKPPNGFQVDHINGDGLDNRRSNLRICTNAQNAHNSSKYVTNKSGYKGVSWINREQKYVAQIETGGKGRTIGYFDDPSDAAKAYDRVARELFGEFARTNF